MFKKVKATSSQLLGNSNARVILILASLLIAALVGGAPHDIGGG